MADCRQILDDPSNPHEVCGSCVTYFAVEPVPYQPARVDLDPLLGWNAGARSIDRRAAPCYVEFDMPAVVGVVVGLAPEFLSVMPEDVPCGFFFERSAGGLPFYSVVEFGVQKTVPAQHAEDALFRIERRAGGAVHYLVGGSEVYESESTLSGALVVVALMYAAGDGVGRAA